MKSLIRKHTLVGPGGMKCSCCAPQSGTKAGAKCRHAMKRNGLTRFYRINDRELSKEMEP